MSTFCFIATDKELPEVDYTNRQIITLREAIAQGSIKEDIGGYKFKNLDAPMVSYESYDDFHALQIYPWNGYMHEIEYYTDKPYIYEVIFRASEKNIQHLIAYLQDNIHTGESLELWKIWLDDFQKVNPKSILLKYLKARDLEKWMSKGPCCLHIKESQ